MGLPLSSLSLAAIFCGAGLGALLRVWFNTVSVGLSAIVPMGTLISNLLGCYLVGIALAYFTSHPSVSPEWRLFIITEKNTCLKKSNPTRRMIKSNMIRK